MPSRRSILFLLASVAALACDSADRIAGPRDFRRLDLAEERWQARGFADYTYEIRSTCFCPPELGRWTRVTVQNGRVTSAVPVTPDPFFPNNTLRYWDPVDSIFASVRHFMLESHQSYYEAVLATYDPALGYPTLVEYRARSTVADAGGVIELRNVRALP